MARSPTAGNCENGSNAFGHVLPREAARMLDRVITAMGAELPEMIHVTVYRSAHAPEPIAIEDFPTWGELADELEAMTREFPECPETASREEQKEAMLAFAPHRLRERCARGACIEPRVPGDGMWRCGGNKRHRLAVNVEAVTLLVLDVDSIAWADGTRGDTKELAARTRTISDRGLIYESPSSTADVPRVRVVCPTSREITNAIECRAARIGAALALGLDVPACGVLGAIDPAKLFFAGRMHGTPERRVWRW